MTYSVGVIGLGIIGKPIAERLVKAGFRVAVHDVRDEPVAELKNAGATACASSAEVAGRSDIVISLVLDRAQTNDVVFGEKGVIQTIRPGTLFATGSTLGPAPVRSIAAALAAKGCPTLDMPITGGYLAAYEGKLVLMIGGAQDALERALPVCRAFAQNILRVGDIGAGQVAKLAHQLVMSVNVIALLEGCRWARRAASSRRCSNRSSRTASPTAAFCRSGAISARAGKTCSSRPRPAPRSRT